MRKWMLIGALMLAACGGSATDGGDESGQTVTQYCVEQVEAMYKRHDLPFTSEPADRPDICTKWMTDNGLETKADITTKIRELDKYYRDLKK